MAKLKIPYLRIKARSKTGPARFYFGPSPRLAGDGWKTVALATDEATAIRQARAIKAVVDRWRAGAALKDKPAAADFAAAFAAANAAASADEAADAVISALGGTGVAGPTRSGTTRALIRDYKASHTYAELRPATRAGYEQHLKAIDKWMGDAPACTLTHDVCVAYYQSIAYDNPDADTRGRPTHAARRMASLAELFRFGMTRPEYRLTSNPAIGIKRRRVRKAQDRMALLWRGDKLDAMIAAADALGMPSVGDAIALNVWWGQRPTDVLTIRRNQIDVSTGVMRLQQSKTGAWVEIETPAMLLSRLTAARTRQTGATTLIVSPWTGRPFYENEFQKAIRKTRDEAAKTRPECAALQFKHTRHTAVVAYAEADVDLPGIAAITGHTLKSLNAILEHYLVRTTRLAKYAVAARIAAEQA